MKSTGFLRIFLSSLAIFLLASCGGPDHNDPQSVADAALKCYVDEDTKGMIALLDPANKEKQEGFKQFCEMLEGMKKEGIGQSSSKKERAQFEDYIFKKMTGEYGLPVTESTTEIEVYYNNSNGRNVMIPLERVDGKWYLAGLPQ